MKRGEKRAATEKPALSDEERFQRIAVKAYEIFVDRGQTHGHDEDDWLEAEQIVLAELEE